MTRPRPLLPALAIVIALGACARGSGPAADPRADAGAAPTPANASRPELADAMREDAGAGRSPADGGGRAWLESQEPATLRAGGRGRFVLVYEAGPLGVAVGGAVLFQVSPFWGWSTPQVEDPAAPGFTTVRCEPAARAGDATPTPPPRLVPATLDRQLLGIRIEDGPLRQGDRVRIVYGAGDAAATVDRFAERRSRFWIGVDGDGDGRRALVGDPPAVDIGAGPAARVVALLPSAAEPRATVPLTLAVVDALGSAGVEFEGTLALSTANREVAVPPAVVFGPGDAGVRRIEVTVGDTDVVRIEVRGPGDLAATTNPLVVSPGAQRILWADLHGHSGLSDGTGTPEDYLRYARDVAALDVCALTDHDYWGMVPLAKSPQMWQEIREQVERFHEPGRFVSLLGFEWTNWVSGHRHVIYFGPDGDDPGVLSSLDPRYQTPELLWAALRGRPVLTLAHHPAGGPVSIDWSIPPDPELEPAVEVVSVHGSSEAPEAPIPIYDPVPGRFVRDALGRGYRLGFVGSGDSHDGHPGLAHLASPSGGVAALLTSDATRESVLQALRERRSYATNGPRIVLRVALDGARMGSVVAAAGEHRLQLVVAGTGPIERVELVRSGGRVEALEADGRLSFTAERELGPLVAGELLYVRVVQSDGGAAWSSPFYFQ